MNSIEQIIFESLKPHIFIEFYYKKRKAFLNEDFKNKKMLFEMYGIFDGCEEIAQKIINAILNYPSSNELYIPIGNKFVDTIKVIISDDLGQDASYDSNLSILYKNGRFLTLAISIRRDIINEKSNLLGIIMHELIHSYQDYNLLQKGETLSQRLDNIGYFKNKTGKYEDDNLKSVVSWLLYYFNGYEKSAYIANIEGELLRHHNTFFNISEVIDFIKDTNTYYNYEIMFKYAEQVSQVDNDDTKEKLLEYANKLSNYNFKTYHEFCQWVKKQCISFKKSFETILPKLAYRHIQLGEIISPQFNGRLNPRLLRTDQF